MAFKITESCVACGSCAETCPMEAVTEDFRAYVIDQGKCIECGACAAACPFGAIVEEN